MREGERERELLCKIFPVLGSFVLRQTMPSSNNKGQDPTIRIHGFWLYSPRTCPLGLWASGSHSRDIHTGRTHACQHLPLKRYTGAPAKSNAYILIRGHNPCLFASGGIRSVPSALRWEPDLSLTVLNPGPRRAPVPGRA